MRFAEEKYVNIHYYDTNSIIVSTQYCNIYIPPVFRESLQSSLFILEEGMGISQTITGLCDLTNNQRTRSADWCEPMSSFIQQNQAREHENTEYTWAGRFPENKHASKNIVSYSTTQHLLLAFCMSIVQMRFKGYSNCQYETLHVLDFWDETSSQRRFL